MTDGPTDELRWGKLLLAEWYGRFVTKVVYWRIFHGDRPEIDGILWDICFMWSQDIGLSVRNVRHFIFEVPSKSIMCTEKVVRND